MLGKMKYLFGHLKFFQVGLPSISCIIVLVITILIYTIKIKKTPGRSLRKPFVKKTHLSIWIYLMLTQFVAIDAFSTVLLVFVPFLSRYKVDGRRVDAITLLCWLRSVIKHVAHMCATFGTSHFSSYAVWVFKK